MTHQVQYESARITATCIYFPMKPLVVWIFGVCLLKEPKLSFQSTVR
jgi:hypothetical protein